MAKILVVDDDRQVLAVTELILESAGHVVTSVERSAESLLLVTRESFDMALVDYTMPEVDGLQVLQRLRDLQPRCLRVLVSGNLDLPIVLDAVNRGEVARVVPKPFAAEELLCILGDAMGARDRLERLIMGDGAAGLGDSKRCDIEDVLGSRLLELALQPIVGAKDRKVVAYEALIRCKHPKLNGALPVLQAAEKHDLIHELAAVVASRVVEWINRIDGEPLMFMNLHPRELVDTERMRARVTSLTPWASRVVMEITERSYLLEIDSWSQSVAMLGGLGFGVAVDDLGSGYNALTVLAALRPHFVKVDMSIVRGVDAEPRKQRLIELLAKFAGATDAKLIAEGVETEAEAQALVACGVDLLQGYHLGRPSLELPRPSA